MAINRCNPSSTKLAQLGRCNKVNNHWLQPPANQLALILGWMLKVVLQHQGISKRSAITIPSRHRPFFAPNYQPPLRACHPQVDQHLQRLRQHLPLAEHEQRQSIDHLDQHS